MFAGTLRFNCAARRNTRFSAAGVLLHGDGSRLLGVAPKLHQAKSGNTTTKECRHARKP
jgi:hypothetical protein